MKCVFLALILIVVATGCSREKAADPAVAEKIHLVLAEMVRQSKSDEEKAQLQKAEPFQNIAGVEMQLAGFSVPIGTNRAHISFTIDHLRKTKVDVLAKEAFEDIRLAAEQSN